MKWLRPAAVDGRGQASVELALALPLVALLLLALVQVGVVVRARVMLTHGAREGARVAAVGGSDREVTDAVVQASGLARSRLRVEVARDGVDVQVRLRYVDPTDLPLIGALMADAAMTAEARMRAEPP